jgi:two-component system, LytTR family, response regulator
MQTSQTRDLEFRPAPAAAPLRLVSGPAPRQSAMKGPHARIAIKDRNRILLIDPGTIVAVVAQGNYVLLQHESGSYCLRESISATAEKLGPYGFVRVHRSALVNRSWVEEVAPYLAGECLVRTRGGRHFRVTRTYKKNLKSLAELWLGSELSLG